MKEKDNQIEQIIENIVKPLIVKYKELCLTSEQIKQIISKELKILSKNNQKDLNRIDRNKLKQSLDNILSLYIITDLKESKIILNRYINTHMKYSENVTSNFEQLKKLSLFYSRIHYTIENIEECIDVIKNNEIISNILASIVNSNFRDNKRDEVITYFIESYKMMYGVDIEEIEQDNDDIGVDLFYSDDSTNYFLQEIRQIPLLTPSEEKELLKLASEGDAFAKEKLISSNLRLVADIARKYFVRCKSLTFLDLIQEGSFGLMKAIDKFDLSKGFKFSTYATWWIRQSIVRAINDKDKTIRVPVRVKEEIIRYQRIENQLIQKLNRKPTLEEMSKKLGLTYKKTLELYRLQLEPISLQIKLDEDYELEDTIVGEEYEFSFDESSDIVKSIQCLLEHANLTEGERKFIEMRYGFGKYKYPEDNLAKIAKALNCSREWARQLEIRSLRQLSRSKYLKELLVYADDENSAIKNIEFYRNNLANGQLSKPQVKTSKKEVKPLSEILNCTEEKFEEAFSMLTEDEKELVVLRNKRVSEKESSNLSHEQNEKLKLILRKMRFLLVGVISADEEKESTRRGHSQIQKNMFELLECSEDEYYSLLSYLSPEDLILLELRNGKDLYNPVSDPSWNNSYFNLFEALKQRMKEKLKVIRGVQVTNQGRHLSTMYELLSCTKEEYNCLVLGLSDNDKNLIFLRNGENIDSPVKSELWNADYSREFFNLTAKLKSKLAVLRGEKREGVKTMYEFLGCTKEEYQILVDILSDDEKNLLYLRNGNDIDNPVKSSLWNESYSKKFQRLIVKMKTKLTFLRKPMHEILKCTEEEYQTILNMLSDAEISILYLRNGENLDLPISCNNIWNRNYACEFEKLLYRMRAKLRNIRANKQVKVKKISSF